MSDVFKRGPKNLITDVSGLLVGNAQNQIIKSGVSVLYGVNPFLAGINVMGGAPGTRETDLLAPDKLVQLVDAIVLSGGSAFGLDAASGVTDELRKKNREDNCMHIRLNVTASYLSLDNNIIAFEHGDHTALLDGERLFETVCIDSTQEFFAQFHIVETFADADAIRLFSINLPPC